MIVIAQEQDAVRRRRILEDLTARLPQWFGQPESNRRYAAQAEKLDGWVARIDEEPCGLLMMKRQGPNSAEIHWLGVAPDCHRRGIGRTLVTAVEDHLRKRRTRFLFVMTLHPDVGYEPYARTRAFYEALGFELVLSDDRGPSDPLAWYLKLLA